MTALSWVRSSRCSDNACAEVAADPDRGMVTVRRMPGDWRLPLTDAEWVAFRDGIKAGDFDNL